MADTVTLDLSTWIQVLVLGGISGAIGQGARAVIGIKKVNDEATSKNLDAKDLIVVSRLVISLTIGFIAGAFAAILLGLDPKAITGTMVLGLAATGYAGTDFIEGIINKVSPSATPAPNPTAVPQASAVATPPSVLSAPPPAADDYLG